METSLVPSKCRVALLAGGKSGEREISLLSGEGAKGALEEAGFQVVQLDPAKKEDLITLLTGEFNVAFLCLHGKYGEDGTMQGFLEIAGIPYTGSGVWASALAMDKAKSKEFYRHAGIRTPESLVLYQMPEGNALQGIIDAVGIHCVVKPADEGSALGVHIVEGEQSLFEALRNSFESSGEVLVETFVDGDEYTVAVVGNEEPEALPAIQIVPSNDFYDFESKYAPGGSRHICPAPLPDDQAQELADMAIAAHKALECRGVSRSDFIKDAEGRFWILETNTLPGMTKTSLLPDAARAAGIAFPELCTRLIQYALQ